MPPTVDPSVIRDITAQTFRRQSGNQHGVCGIPVPVCLHRSSTSDLAVILMAPPQDCFAIATPHAGEGHYSLYLSLFGHDIKAGETATAHTRLIVTPHASPDQVLALHRQYLNDSPAR